MPLLLEGLFLGGALGSFVAGIAYAHGGWPAASLAGFSFPLVGLLHFATEHDAAC